MRTSWEKLENPITKSIFMVLITQISEISVIRDQLLTEKSTWIQAPGFICGKNKGFYHYSKPLALDMGSIL